MAFAIDWSTGVVTVPQSDLSFVSGTLYAQDTRAFWEEIKALEASEVGMPFIDIQQHASETTIAGITYAQSIEIINGYTVTFQDAQYATRLDGSNNNIFDEGVINRNQVSVIPTNSAGLITTKQVADSAFLDGRTFIDTIDGTAGTTYPQGTTADPVDNLTDAQSIITVRRLPDRLLLRNSLTLGVSDVIDDYDIQGFSAYLSSIVVTAGASTDNLSASNLKLSGTLTGTATLSVCSIEPALLGFDGEMRTCGLTSKVTLGTSTEKHVFVDCYSEVAGTATPEIDCNDLAGLDVSIRRYAGGIEITNFSDAGGLMTIDLTSGNIILDSTCSAGTIVVRGVGTLTDSSGAGCTVVSTGLTSGTGGGGGGSVYREV